MLAENQPPWEPGKQCAAGYECCRITTNVSVEYANQDILFPDQFSLGDELILHALGVAW